MSEIKEKIQEIMDDLKGRIRNPLILSFILVWCYLHWNIIITLLDTGLVSEVKNAKIRNEIEEAGGWCGTIGKPLLYSIISLGVYYIIAILAQFIKAAGKRLNAYVLAKFDTGNFIHKSEVDALKAKVKRINNELINANELVTSFSDERKKLERQYSETSGHVNQIIQEKEALEQTIHSSKNFVSNFRHTLLYLLSESKKVRTPAVGHEVLKEHYRPINGNWQTFSGNQISDRTGTMKYYFIKEHEVSDLNGDHYGIIKELYYDKKNFIMSFKMEVLKQKATFQLYLIRIHEDEWIGFEEGNFIQFRRYLD